MHDTIEIKDNLKIHHGKVNNRLYLMKSKTNNWSQAFEAINTITNTYGYEKIITRVPASAKDFFLTKKFSVEALVPGLYNGTEDGYFFANYHNEKRSIVDEKKLNVIESVKTIAKAAKKDPSENVLSNEYTLRQLDISDIDSIIKLNTKILGSYPFPFFNKQYLEKSFSNEFKFYGIQKDNELLVYCYIKEDIEHNFIEIVDFITHPSYNGKNLSQYLVSHIIDLAFSKNIRTVLCLVRATSYGLNIMLRKNEFLLSGTLNNNTLIDDSIESVNVWYKSI